MKKVRNRNEERGSQSKERINRNEERKEQKLRKEKTELKEGWNRNEVR